MDNNSDNFVPAYVKIQNYILENIQNGTYTAGELIPSENELSQIFSVNRNTVNRAIKELSIMDVVKRVRGKGTFVTDPDSLPSAAKVLSPRLHLKSYGTKFHTLESCSLVTIPEEVCTRFHLASGAKGYQIVRSLHHQGRREALDYSYLPVELFDALTIDQKQLEQSFFHDYLRNFTDRKPAYVKIYINTPHYSFLDLEPYFSPDTALLLWTTDILDENKQVIGSTITASPEGSENDSFITFSIE